MRRAALTAGLAAVLLAAFAGLAGLGGALAGTDSTAADLQYQPEGAIPLPNGQVSIPASSVEPAGVNLLIGSVRFTPNPVRSRARPILLRVRVSDTRGFVVRNALVFARSTPLVTRSPGEVATNLQGFATIRFTPRADFPLQSGYSVQFFIRARRLGDNLLAGVSARRLVQVRTATPR